MIVTGNRLFGQLPEVLTRVFRKRALTFGVVQSGFQFRPYRHSGYFRAPSFLRALFLWGFTHGRLLVCVNWVVGFSRRHLPGVRLTPVPEIG